MVPSDILFSAASDENTDDQGHLREADDHEAANLNIALSTNFTSEIDARFAVVNNSTQNVAVESETGSTVEITTTIPKVTIPIPVNLKNDENFEGVTAHLKNSFFDDLETPTKSKTSNESTPSSTKKQSKKLALQRMKRLYLHHIMK
ncbi:hypothetical protein KIN20_021384 [Parelaphostrongylus tenuis]|uniref:Uncharacterized protein n=1 Tax=Parelaphostrongylus tenuis TaxID=148309 RepID=A0AAD5N7V9_PARTN|nr:hypothetical protein KIN20_021384 [Parelaphostrongylus tenuis]